MVTLLRSLFLGAALFSAVAGCSVSSADMAAGDDDGGGGTTGSGGSGAAAVMIAFDKVGPWVLRPNEKQDLKVTVTPIAPPHVVRFALLDGSEPQSVADAALNLTEATTNALGEVVVQVTAPSVPTEFDLRAIVGTTWSKLNIAVGRNGKATLVVEPMYAGDRSVTEWVAEVYEDGRTCADLKGNPPEGEAPAPKHSVTVTEGEPIVIEEVTVGTKLAVTLRAGYFAGGCSGMDGVVEGQENSVLVTVTNRPIQLDQSHATLRLGLSGQEDALTDGFQSVIADALTAVLGPAASDAEALLDAMQEEATAGAVCTGNRFGNARESNGWDVELTTALGAAATASIRDDFGAWLAAGVPSLAQDEAFVGELGAIPDMTGRAELALETVAGFDARDAGFPSSVACTWTADAHDNVAFGGTIPFNPAALLVLAALEPALAAEPTATTLEQALALSGERCATVTATLTANGQGVDQSCLPCDVACTRELCERGLARLVNRAIESLDDAAELQLAATGYAEVGDQAELERLEGIWVGNLDAANRPSELSGDVSAAGNY